MGATPKSGITQGAVRADRGELLRAVRTSEGYILAEGFAARPGVMRYSDGEAEWLELVPEETLHDSESLLTLAGKPLTVEHPAQPVGPDNVGELGAGDVGDEVTIADNGYLRVKVAARRRDALEAIDTGKQELSPGYTCDVDWTPGEHPKYGRYDAVQRNRRYNHLALVDRARGGPSIRLRVDGAAEQVDSQPEPPAQPERTPMDKLIAMLIELGWPEEAAKVAAAGLEKAKPGANAEGEGKPEVEVEIDAQGAAPASDADPDYKAMYEDMCKQRDAAVEALKGMVKGDALPALFADWLAVRTKADAWGVKHDGLAADAVRAAVVEKAKPGALRKDASAAEVKAAFSMLPDSPAAGSPWHGLTARVDAQPAAKADGGYTYKIGQQPKETE